MILLQRNGNDRIVGEGAVDAEAVVKRLEEAGRTLLALPQSGPSTRLVQSGMEWVRDVQETYDRDRTRLRPAVPDAASISRMDEALAWIPLIPIDRYVLRRIVGARSLVSPMTGRYMFSWRRLGEAIGADHKAVKQWHAKGIVTIVSCLRDGRSASARTRGFPQTPGHHRRGDA